MHIRQAVNFNLRVADALQERYLADLSPADLLARPVPGANHIAWQLGHLIAAEAYLLRKAVPGVADPLPAGFADRHNKETASLDAPGKFLSIDEYRRVGRDVRAATLSALERLAPGDFDAPAPQGVPPFCTTVGDIFLMIGQHWTMHEGQWAVTRRALGRPPLF